MSSLFIKEVHTDIHFAKAMFKELSKKGKAVFTSTNQSCASKKMFFNFLHTVYSM